MADLDFRPTPSTRVNARLTALRVAGLALFFAFAACLAACGGGEESSSYSPKAKAPAAQQPQADTGTAKTMNHPEGWSTGSVPDDFPKDVPLYPGATPGDSLAIPGGAAVAIFNSDDSVETVLAFYEKQLPEQGWSIQNAREGMVSANKGKRTVTVAVEAREAGSEIAVGVTGG